MNSRRKKARHEGAADLDEANRLWRIQSELPSDREEAYRALQERVKELNCLYGVAQLVERHADSVEGFFSAVAEFLPSAWQRPELTCARICYAGVTYESPHFREGPFRPPKKFS